MLLGQGAKLLLVVDDRRVGQQTLDLTESIDDFFEFFDIEHSWLQTRTKEAPF